MRTGPAEGTMQVRVRYAAQSDQFYVSPVDPDWVDTRGDEMIADVFASFAPDDGRLVSICIGAAGWPRTKEWRHELERVLGATLSTEFDRCLRRSADSDATLEIPASEVAALRDAWADCLDGIEPGWRRKRSDEDQEGVMERRALPDRLSAIATALSKRLTIDFQTYSTPAAVRARPMDEVAVEPVPLPSDLAERAGVDPQGVIEKRPKHIRLTFYLTRDLSPNTLMVRITAPLETEWSSFEQTGMRAVAEMDLPHQESAEQIRLEFWAR